MRKLNYAVLGAGNGGQCVSAYLKLRGYQVSLYDRYEHVIEPIKTRGGIALKGVSLNGFAKIDIITTDLKEAVENADVILVVLPAFAHEYIAENLSSILHNDQVIVLCPGSTGGALEFRRVLNDKKCNCSIKLAETNSLFYASRIDASGTAVIGGVKEVMPIAALPSSDVDEIIDIMHEAYPQLVKEENVLTSDMSNMNAVVHPLPVILNTGWIEATGGSFKYYYDGITPTIGNLVEKTDTERMEICRALGIKVKSIKDSMYTYYKAQGDSLCKMFKNISAYEIVNAPEKVESRLLTEDVPMGLVPMTELAKLVNVKTPIMDMTIDLASTLLNRDFRSNGRTLEKLGISGMDRESLLKYIK
ncbi:NAD/NADP-dependent octopine/nopaline dehydrogenase family protein [Petroclostridium sp. X23]|uniref:NAD/NADP-dependent octopine/nopaline dehydrogenase family protein n=1 Tax=Petroclostridium sp. X23 TaxID=3045146 RepID=UPI0024AE6C49|nr:NAD/NADP-dependent octopine/nopaline dehydrogenase family protein [Petroclostridium sp. X23]WHH60460.1 NAD/NADP octopine/nopaline dehydrogenase family protein [Petroclostridium sp. X23]